MRYVALLRGINVGGKNIISKVALKAVFEELGFSDVSTYINSGNVLFCHDDEEARDAIQARCVAAIGEALGASVPVAVLTAQEIVDALHHAPDWWDGGDDDKHNAIFAIPPMTARDIIDAVGPEKQAYERIASHGQVIFWSAPLKTFSRTRWAKITSMPVYDAITIRNANTARKLAKLVE